MANCAKCGKGPLRGDGIGHKCAACGATGDEIGSHIDWTNDVIYVNDSDDAKPVRVLCADAGDPWPVVLLVSSGEQPFRVTIDGRLNTAGPVIFRNRPVPKVKKVGWVNLVKTDDGEVAVRNEGNVYESHETAQKSRLGVDVRHTAAGITELGTFKIEWEE